ncbi:Homocysteine S-methyltransferase [Metschnikowia bicuspidata]|uniref:Homocysteine S-methyltransferase n=1 Tax=Metschnikowia bicuspidata TaxID=27322 RepID=A0A4P9ZCY1_9ASCO|nr:Homocysteine S-methyltransferase [Metschnikowia bicuspidata]
MSLPLSELLKDRRLILDGSMGASLEALFTLDHPLSVKDLLLYSTKALLQEPSWITNVHRSYLAVGAQMLITATYQASWQTLSKYARICFDDSRKKWQLAIGRRLSGKVYIAGSIGPYGAFLANGAEYSEVLAEYHREHLKFFVQSDCVEVVAFETIPNFDEVKAIFQLIRQYMYSQQEGLVGDNFICSGCNCVSYEIVPGIIKSFNDTASCLGWESIPLIVYLNLGFCNDTSNPSEYGFRSDYWLSVPNVRVIGGCCSTGPYEVDIIAKGVALASNKTE